MSRSTEPATADDLPRAVPALWRTFMFGYRAEPRLLLASLGHDVADDAARRPAGPVAEAAHRRRDRRRPHGDHDRRRRPRPVDGRHLVPQRRQPAPGPAVPRPPGHRHGGPHRPPPGDASRPSSTRSAPTTSTAWPCCATRRSPSTTCSRRCSATSGSCSGWPSRPCCWRRSTRRSLLLPLAGLPAVLTSLWRPGVERSVEESVAAHDRLARHLFVVGTTRGAGQGGPRHRHRRRPAVAPPRRAGGVAAPDGLGPLGVGAVGIGGVGDLRHRLRRSASPGWPAASTRASATSCSSSSPGSACRSTSARPSASSASCVACGWTRRCG